MMKILHIDTERTWRGGEQQVLYLVKGLKKRGHESTVLCQPGSELSKRCGREGISVQELRMRSGVDPHAVISISRLLKRDQYDVIHLHTSNAHTLGVLASLLLWKRPKVVASRRVSFPVKGFIKRLKYNRTDRVIAVSEGVRRGLINGGIDPESVVTIHSSIDLSRFMTGRKGQPDSMIVGVVAHLAEHKGHKYFFDAAREISAEMPDVRFLVVGDGDLRDELVEYARSLGIYEKTEFAGFQKDVPRMISRCAVTVLPSISGEGSPGVLKESMAAGVPVVTTDVGGSSEVVEDGVTGYVVPPMDSGAIARALSLLLKDKGLRERMGAEGREKVMEFSDERMVEKTEAVYRGLLKR